jgi:hypothetical protein
LVQKDSFNFMAAIEFLKSPNKVNRPSPKWVMPPVVSADTLGLRRALCSPRHSAFLTRRIAHDEGG